MKGLASNNDLTFKNGTLEMKWNNLINSLTQPDTKSQNPNQSQNFLPILFRKTIPDWKADWNSEENLF